MNTHNNIVGSILLAITVAAASGAVEAGKGNGNGGGSSSSYGSGNGSMHRSGQTTGYGNETRNNNQYRHQNQHRYQNGNGSAQGNMYRANADNGQYSDDMYLNQQDFQAWLNQNQNKAKTQKHNQVQNMAQDGM